MFKFILDGEHIYARFHIDHLPQVVDVALEGCRNIYTILDKVSNLTYKSGIRFVHGLYI